MDFLDEMRLVDDCVDQHLSEDGTLTMPNSQVYPDLRGPFRSEEFTDETGEARTTVLITTYSVQSTSVPYDPRGGILQVRGELFKVVDFDSTDDDRNAPTRTERHRGRKKLILDKHAAT